MNKVITIGREFGSGGRELGRRLAEELGIAYYDSEIVTEIAKRTELSEEYVRSVVERRPVSSYPIHIGRSFQLAGNYQPKADQAVFAAQCAILKEMAQKSDCVIVGCCADEILKEFKLFKLFIYADMESKIARCRKKVPAESDMTDKELKKYIEGVDKHRAAYYEYYTGKKWADKLGYDLLINTSNVDIKYIVPYIAKIV